MLTFHTKQLTHHLIWTLMQRPSIVSSVISGLIKSMQGRSSISLRSVASEVFKYLTSSKNPTFNNWNGMFSLHELCQLCFPIRPVLWVSCKTISFTFGFLTSFMRTCLFSCFLRTLALISKVSYKYFQVLQYGAWLVAEGFIKRIWERSWTVIFAYFGIVYSSSCVWNLFDGVGFTPLIFTSNLFRYACLFAFEVNKTVHTTSSRSFAVWMRQFK